MVEAEGPVSPASSALRANAASYDFCLFFSIAITTRITAPARWPTSGARPQAERMRHRSGAFSSASFAVSAH